MVWPNWEHDCSHAGPVERYHPHGIIITLLTPSLDANDMSTAWVPQSEAFNRPIQASGKLPSKVTVSLDDWNEKEPDSNPTNDDVITLAYDRQNITLSCQPYTIAVNECDAPSMEMPMHEMDIHILQRHPLKRLL